MSILGSIVQASGGGGGGTSAIGEEAGSTAANADANTKRLFLDTEKSNLLTAIDENGVLTIIDEFVDTPQTTAATLETNFPAANNESLLAWVAGTTAENGLYLSNGAVWIKQLDNSGDRTTLFDYASGLVYSGSNDVSGQAGSVFWKQSDEITDVSSANEALAFDNSDITYVSNGGDINTTTNSILYKTYSSSAVLRAARMSYRGSSASNTTPDQIQFVGIRLNGDIVTLTPSNLVGSGSISGSTITGLQIVNAETQVDIAETEEFNGHGIRIVSYGSSVQCKVGEVRGQTVVDLSGTINCVNAVNKLYAGVSKIEPTALTADTLLDDTDGTVLLDPSGADFTMTLPAVATVQTGKKYTFVLTTAPATTAVTLDGDGAETINGAATNATALTAQWDTVTIMSDGTQWVLTSDGAASSFEAGSEAQTTIDRLEENIGLNSLRDAVNGGWSWFNMIDGVADVFTDETGVNTGAATNQLYNAAGDYYSPVISGDSEILLHLDGTDGSTTFTDSSPNVYSCAAVGDAQIDTAQSKFGGASGLFDGTLDAVSVTDGSDSSAGGNFGSGNFTVDCWFRIPDVSGFKTIGGKYAASQQSWAILINNNVVNFYTSTSGTGAAIALTSTAILAADTWTHVAVVRNGSTLTMYLDGVQVDQDAAFSQTLHTSTTNLTVGDVDGANAFVGHIDEFRVSKTAVWTTAFTPPTSAYVLTNGAMTLPSDAFTTLATPISARLVVLYDPIDAVTLNTDLIFECSRDGGTTWTAWTLAPDATFAGTVEILTTEDLDISAQPTGSTSIVWRATTANNKNIQIHGVYLQWR